MRLEEEDRIDSDTSPVPVSTKVGNRTGQPVVNQANQTQKPKKRKPRWNGLHRCVPISQSGRKNPGNIWWMTEVLNTETHTRVLLMNYLWNLREVWIWAKHSAKTHFPKDRNCETCQRKKITRAPCRRRNGGAVHRAENFGDLITANHKVLSEGCESRNNHRYAVVVQDSATHWIQSYPCKTKTSQQTQRSLQKFLEPSRKPKFVYPYNSLEFGKYCENLSWNHCTSIPHRSETDDIAERAVRRVEEGTSAVLLQSGLEKIGGQIPWNALPICETFKISCLMGKLNMQGVLEKH